ncbi:hypothetical protein SK128_027877 [Halocaridina rubra]|uniref:Uncharacterized protein n=1 Tax=Halocaridina rubra TaxID=373956 RepID=A0AAN8ZYP4_HALRR
MLEHKSDRSRDPSSERPRVSFEQSAVEASDGDASRKYRTKKSQKDEVRFGDLKHDWGGVQTKAGKTGNGKQKEMRFGEIKTKNTVEDDTPPEKTKEMRFGDHMRPSSNAKPQSTPTSPSETLPVMRFGDTPLNLFPASQTGVQSSSKFESVAGPDPTKMTAEQLNQNVEEYDFPIPTVVSSEDHKPKPKSILKRRSVENVLHELKKEEKGELLQKVEHRKSASFDWDNVDNQVTSTSTPAPELEKPAAKTRETDVSQTSTSDKKHSDERQELINPDALFRFSFNPEQTLKPKTSFVDIETDSLLQQKTQKEAENKQRLEGLKVFTIITNPNDVNHSHGNQNGSQLNGHINGISPNISSHSEVMHKAQNTNNQERSIQNENMKSSDLNARPSWKKLIAQNLAHSNADKRKSLDKLQDVNPKQKHYQVRVESAEDDVKKNSSRRKEEEKRKNSLLEWEALQRQKLEDEEKNRINKNLSMKPVSTKIKELVKMHGSFMSMFSKDKKTDINGTVDGKDDIVFRKVSSYCEEFHKPPLKEEPLPMKSPYIVKKMLTPSKHAISPDDSKAYRTSHKELAKIHGIVQHTTPHSSGKSSAKPTSGRDRSQSPTKSQISKDRPRSQSPVKTSARRDRSQSPAVTREYIDRSSVPVKPRRIRNRSQSPSAAINLRTRSSSPGKLHSGRERFVSPNKAHFDRGRSRSPARASKNNKLLFPRDSPVKEDHHFYEHRYISMGRSQTPTKQQKLPQSFSPLSSSVAAETTHINSEKAAVSPVSVDKEEINRSKNMLGSLTETSNNDQDSLSELKQIKNSTISEEKRDIINTTANPSRQGQNLKCVPGKLPSIVLSSQSDSSPVPPKLNTGMGKGPKYQSSQKGLHQEYLNGKPEASEKCGSNFDSEKRKSKERTSIKDPKNRKEWLNKMLNTISSNSVPPVNHAEMGQIGITSLSNQSKQPYENSTCNTETTENKKETTASLPVTPKISAKRNSSMESTYISNSQNLDASPLKPLRKTSALKSPIPSKSLISKFPLLEDSFKNKKSESSPPSTPVSLRSSVREALLGDYHTSSNSKRGPVSLSSILGDSSSRSSSLTSTPLTSPRATPERLIRKDSLDVTLKLDVIPETVMRESHQVPASVDEQKENIAPLSNINQSQQKEDEEISFLSPSVPIRSSFRFRKQNSEKGNVKEHEHKSTESSEKAWNVSSIMPFTTGKPSVTMKTMASDVDLQRVSTTKNQNKEHRSYEDAHIPDSGEYQFYQSNSYPRDNKMPLSSRLSKERSSLRIKVDLGNSPKTTLDGTSQKFLVSKEIDSPFGRVPKKFSVPSFECSERLTPERNESPVSLSSILSKNIDTKYSKTEEPPKFEFNPKLSFSKELNELSNKYCNHIGGSKPQSVFKLNKPSISSSDDKDHKIDRESTEVKDKQSTSCHIYNDSKESTPTREVKTGSKSKSVKETTKERKHSRDMICTCGPKGLPAKSSASDKQKNRIVRRNSSLKRNRQEDSAALVIPMKERRNSGDEPPALKSESLVQNDSGWTKTKTTVRRARLGSFEKTRQIVRTNSGKTRKEKTFKTDASKALENWAAGTNVHGKLMKKEGQCFSHETEEEVKGGQRTSRSVARRVIRRGSRRLTGGGELLTETKETSSEGKPKEGQNLEDSASTHHNDALAIDDGLSRKMKTSTDGERYMTQSVSNKDGKQTYTTEGVNNKTTNSVEVIGGDDFEAKREVQGKTGHRVLVERSKDNLGRPSTVVKKVTSQSRVIITKTKRKTPVVV